MFGKPIHLFRLLGFAVRLDPSWFILALLIVWSLAAGYFPQAYPDLPPAIYWAMGVAGAVGLFLSIVVHELFHSLVARRYGMDMAGITLFIFGGIAEMRSEPPSPRAEGLMAIAGPVASFLIGALCLGLLLQAGAALPLPMAAVLSYLGTINVFLAIFNLIPAFPLDGGRVLRSILWGVKRDLRWATRVSSRIGAFFGVLVIAWGVLMVFQGNFIGGMWLFLIGLFLRDAAVSSYRQLQLRRALEGEPVRRFMKTELVTVPPHLTVRELVEEYIYRHHHKLYPVVDQGKLAGCITLDQVKAVPREEQDRVTVGGIARGCSAETTIHPEMDAMEALSRMKRNRTGRLLVTEGDRLAGIITLKDLLEFFALKVELEGEDGRRRRW